MLTLLSKKQTPQDTLEQKHLAMVQQAATLGRTLARKNVPLPTGDSLLSHIGPVRSSYKNLLAQYVRTGGHEEGVVALGKSNLEQKRQRLEGKLKGLVDKEHQLMLESEPYAEVHEAKSHWWVNVLIACTALLDGILTRQSLTMIESNNNLMQIILLVILVALFMAIPYGVFHLFHLTKTSTYRVWIWGLCACFILAGLGGFAVLRNHYLHNLGATSLSMKAHTAVSVSPLVLFVIQLFSLFVGLLLVFLQSAPELEHRQKHARRFDESLAGVREDILVIERELASLPDEMYRSEVARSNRLSQEAGMEARIRAMFEYALGAFKESNINYRSDQEVPDCFSQHIEL